MIRSGSIIDSRYKLIRLLNSEGASADIWLAIDLNTVDGVYSELLDDVEKTEDSGLAVAIKIYRPENFLDIGEQKFREEFKIAFNCHNSNLLKPINFSIDEDITYLVLPYCKNGSAEKYIGKFDDEELIWKFILDVANGLSYLHAHIPTIIHNDIKPANILISDEGNFLITDFGISLNECGKDSDFGAKSGKGTPAYMAPECFDEVNLPASDIWSFGATLYELIEGMPPYGENGGANLIRTSGLPPFTKYISSEIKNIISECLCADPDVRPTANDLYQKSLLHSYSKPRRENKGRKIVVAALAVIFISIFTYFLFDYTRNKDQATFLGASQTSVMETGDSLANKMIFHNINNYTVNGVPFDMAFVKGGKYEMGTRDEKLRELWKWDFPPHEVFIDDFLIGTTEVTQDLWESVMGNNPSHFVGDSLPVENVSWDDVQKFIKVLNKSTGKKFRLPTEAEWEYAARGGSVGEMEYIYSGGDNIGAVGWYFKNSENKTHKVAQLKPNSLGIYDMAGNVREWTQDWFDVVFYENYNVNPKGPDDGIQKVYRGGAYYNKAKYCTVSYRNAQLKSYRSMNTGFRLVLDKTSEDSIKY